MATFFRSKVLKDVGIVKTPGIACDASTRSTIIGVSLTNLTQSNIFVNMLVADETSVEGYYLKDVILSISGNISIQKTEHLIHKYFVQVNSALIG